MRHALVGLAPVVGQEIGLVDRDHQRAALLDHPAGDGEILLLDHVGGIEHDHHDVGQPDGVERVGDRGGLELGVDAAAAAHAGGVDQAHLAALHCHSTRIESRVMPASGPVSTRSSPTRRLSRVDLPTLGRPTIASSSGRLAASAVGIAPRSLPSSSSSSSGIGSMCRPSASCRSLRPSPCSAETGIGSPRPRPCASARPLLAGAALALVGDQDHLVGALAQPAGEALVERQDAGARVDQEQHDVGAVDGALGEAAHARLERLAADRLPAGGVEQGEGEVAELRRRLAHVAGHARRVVDDGAAPADQAVEQRRLADVGPADDGHPRQRAAGRCRQRRAMSRPESVKT